MGHDGIKLLIEKIRKKEKEKRKKKKEKEGLDWKDVIVMMAGIEM